MSRRSSRGPGRRGWVEILVDIERTLEGRTPTDKAAARAGDLSGYLPAAIGGRGLDVRLRDLTRYLERDPLLKVEAWAMVVALGFAIVVAVGSPSTGQWRSRPRTPRRRNRSPPPGR